jgi:hypothetical protein
MKKKSNKDRGEEVSIGPSLTGHEDLAWFVLGPEVGSGGQELEGPAIMLIQRRDPKLSGKKTGEARPGIVLRFADFGTKKDLLKAMEQAENDLLFGTPDVGTLWWD